MILPHSVCVIIDEWVNKVHGFILSLSLGQKAASPLLQSESLASKYTTTNYSDY